MEFWIWYGLIYLVLAIFFRGIFVGYDDHEYKSPYSYADSFQKYYPMIVLVFWPITVWALLLIWLFPMHGFYAWRWNSVKPKKPKREKRKGPFLFR